MKKAGRESKARGAEFMISTYKTIGEALIKSDGAVDENERKNYKIYINMLEEYRDNIFDGSRGGTTGFTKNGATSVSVPAKSGVVAPRKG